MPSTARVSTSRRCRRTCPRRKSSWTTGTTESQELKCIVFTFILVCLKAIVGCWVMKLAKTASFFGLDKSKSSISRTKARYRERSIGRFFTQSVLIKLASPQAAQLSIHFSRKISSDAPLWGTWLRTHHWWIERDSEKEREDKKAQYPARFKPRPLCHEASTAVPQPLPHRSADKIISIRAPYIRRVASRKSRCQDQLGVRYNVEAANIDILKVEAANGELRKLLGCFRRAQRT